MPAEDASPPSAPPHHRAGLASLILLSAMLLTLAAGITIAAAMWTEARRSGPQPAAFGMGSLVCVYMVLQDGAWLVEHIGAPGGNPNYDTEDPERIAFAFPLSGTERGRPRVWEQTWAIDFQLMPPIQRPARAKPKDPRGAAAREGLAAAIREGAVAWPIELAQAEAARRYNPVNQLLNGIERSPLLLLIMAAPLPPIAILVRRHRRRARAGMCPACGYPRKGLPAGAPCPECGGFGGSVPRERRSG